MYRFFYSLYVTWLAANMPEANYLLTVSLGYIKVWHIDSSERSLLPSFLLSLDLSCLRIIFCCCEES